MIIPDKTRSRASQFAAAIAAMSLCLPSLAASSMPPALRYGGGGLDEVVKSLTLPDPALAAEALEQLGPGASQAIWMLLMGDVDESLELDITEKRQALLLEAVRSWPAKKALARLKEIDAEGKGSEGQAALLEMLSVVGSPLAMKEALALLEGLDPFLLQGANLKHQAARLAQEALTGPLQTRLAFLEGVDEASRPVSELLAQSISATSHPAAPQLLARLAERYPALELQVLRQLSGVDAVLFGTDDRAILRLAQRGLSSDNRLIRRAAVQAAGRWNLPDLFLDVVDALNDPDDRVKRLASGALTRMSGVRRTWGAERWRAWYEEESQWLGRAATLHDQIRGTEAFTAASASTELGKHTLMASVTNAYLRDGLTHAHPRVRMISLQGLAASRHSSAVLPLVSALESIDAEIAGAAHQFLKNISGQELPADSSRWEEWWADLNSQAI